MDRLFFLFFYRACGRLASRFRGCTCFGATVPHLWLSLARRVRGVRRQSTLCGDGPSFGSFSPFERWSASTWKPPCVCPSRSIRFPVLPAEAGAFLIRSGVNRNTVPPAFPSGIGFDPCFASKRPSGGREGRLTAATPTDDSTHKPFRLTLSIHYTMPIINFK